MILKNLSDHILLILPSCTYWCLYTSHINYNCFLLNYKGHANAFKIKYLTGFTLRTVYNELQICTYVCVHCSHQQIPRKHLLWPGRVLDDGDGAANKMDRNTGSYGSHMLVEEVNKKLKIESMPDSIKC